MLTHLFGVKGFEMPVVGLMKQNKNGHNLTQGEGSRSMALFGSACKALLLPMGFKQLAKIIDSTKKFEYTHGGSPFDDTSGFSTFSVAQK